MDFQLNLDTETVAHLAPIDPLCVEPGITVREVLETLKARNRSAVLVCREDVLIGIFSERDALKLMATGADLDVPVESVMATEPVVLTADETVGVAIAKMSGGGYRRLPVVDQSGKATGMVTVKHVLHYLVQHFPTVIYNLPPTPDQATKQREGA